ncbi:gamma-glutamylcyclotransferase [Anaerobacillus alkaliphilus]|uniref:Gamma-glutamylcyclotransferase family protein n=1 Tax=Anaerobacillus alkaliphilus TaxID=1548597 RepID=A0A4Q0VN69_9BACI|nr:gamma-glutamylcyclotransferase family protein [Anaerobacillus alkaliphilus]RXI97743.1 gamma-glutamylcyclotransferase [Anaerobacillus alkaliphilus]
MKKHRVFVYGTLRQHEVNHSLLKQAMCLARQAWTNGILYDTTYGYPAMVTDKEERVYGEVYEISEDQLRRLDELEGYTGNPKEDLYDRVIQTIHTDHGRFDAYVYIFDDTKAAHLNRIDFGDWKCHQYIQQDQHLYFAYGSCMDDERFRKANVDHLFTRIRGCGIAKNYRLAYARRSNDGSRADMVEAEQWVEGKVYEITKDALDYLFFREGVYSGIYRPAFLDVEIAGKKHENVLTFLVIDKVEELAPPEHYALEILRGSKDFVSDEYYQKLVNDLKEKFNLKIK